MKEFGVMQPARIKAKLLVLSREQHHHFAFLTEYPDFELVEVEKWSAEVVRTILPDILLTPTCDWYESVACIEEARRLKIPSLYIMDGVIEWRHQWENPRFGAGGWIAYNQPITTDKAACLGWQSARTLEGWGNTGKCEVIGIPRFDHYLEAPIPRPTHKTPKRLLVMTANTPGFTSDQQELITQSLLDVRNLLKTQDIWEPIWRVRRGLDQQLDLSDRFPEFRGKPLREILAQSDAVLSTPSTVLLEAMLAGLPTATLDYTNSPPYVPTAWMITSREHLSKTLNELNAPSARRLVYQYETLHNCLECYSPATSRMITLIEKMIELGSYAREKNVPLDFPSRFVPVDFNGTAYPSILFDLAKLYPNHPVYSQVDLHALQRSLIYVRQENISLKKKLDDRSLKYLLVKGLRRLYAIATQRRLTK